jgi:hypothetical protein
MRVGSLIEFLAAAVYASSAHAQKTNQANFFGDSTLGSGWWQAWLANTANGGTGSALKNTLIQTSINPPYNGTGAPVADYLMNSQILASYFGLTANPTNGNLNDNKLPLTSATSISGGVNPDASYTISSGGNDVTFVLHHFPIYLLQARAVISGVSSVPTRFPNRSATSVGKE